MKEKRNEHLVIDILNKFEFKVLGYIDLSLFYKKTKKIYGFMSLSFLETITYLKNRNILKEEKVLGDKIEGYSIYGIVHKEPNEFDYAAACSRSSHFSHYTALFFHNLTLQIPKSIYLTIERNVTHNNLIITQEKIDEAFKNKPRISSNTRNIKRNQIYIINGKNSEKIGIIHANGIQFTDLERTLIEIAVRPFYAGGVTQVLEAYIKAKNDVDMKKLYDYYNKFKYTYPYYQAIGFYLEKAGYKNTYILPFLKKEKPFKFYLTYNMKITSFSDKWNLFYPIGL